jgi:hypothetical protein
MRRLETIDGLGMKLPDAVRAALEAMPASSFAAPPAGLACRLRSAGAVRASLRRALRERTLRYDDVVEEALRRKSRAGPADGLKALSSLVEHEPGDLVLARDLAFTAMEWGLDGQACGLLRRVVEKRPFERPTWHATALALEAAGRTDLALAFYEAALALGGPTGRYGDFELVLAFDYLRLLRRIERGEATTSVPEFARARLATVGEVAKLREADLVIVMAWNTDRTDVDLHVTDPSGEEAFYSHRDTKIGGHMTQDVTTGFGPELFVLEKAIPGAYRAKAHYFGTDTLSTGARSKAYVTIYEDWGRPRERVTRRTVALGAKGQEQDIATVERRP